MGRRGRLELNGTACDQPAFPRSNPESAGPSPPGALLRLQSPSAHSVGAKLAADLRGSCLVTLLSDLGPRATACLGSSALQPRISQGVQ